MFTLTLQSVLYRHPETPVVPLPSQGTGAVPTVPEPKEKQPPNVAKHPAPKTGRDASGPVQTGPWRAG